MKLITETRGLEYQILQGEERVEVTSLVYDSRKLTEGCLFVCIEGSTFDSHSCIDEAVKKGAAAIVIEKEVPYPAGITVCRVQNARLALALLSAAFFSYPAESMTVIGVTGTKGKTTLTHMLHALLEAGGKKTGLIGTNGIRIGESLIPTQNTTPESFVLQEYFSRMVKEGCTHVVMEVSSQGVMMHRSAGIRFDYGIFTNLSPDHIGLGEHDSFEEYAFYKAKFFSQCKKALLNRDDLAHGRMAEAFSGEEFILYGKDKGADYYFGDVSFIQTKSFVGTRFLLLPEPVLECLVGIPGYFNLYNALPALIVGRLEGISEETLGTALAHLRVDGRMELCQTDEAFTVLIDYAHNAVSMESLLDTLRAYKPRRLVVVFGCGGNRSRDRRYSMGEIAGKKADLSIITADNSRFEKIEDILSDIVSALAPTGGQYVTIPDRMEAICHAIWTAREGDMIAVIGKGHEDYQEANGVRHYFKDRDAVEEALRLRKEGKTI